MGEMADLIVDAWDYWGEPDYEDDAESRELCDKGVWLTKYNDEIRIDNLSYAHATNILKMLEKYPEWRSYYIPKIKFQISKLKSQIQLFK